MYLSEIEKYKQIEPPQDLMQEDCCNVLLLLQSIIPANLLTEDDNNIDINAIGKETKRKLREAFPQNIHELNVFLVKEYDSLLRFGNYDFLKAEFEKHITKRENIEEEEASIVSTYKQPLIVDSSTLQFSRINPNYHKKDNSLNGKSSYIDYPSKQNQNAKIGKSAEKIVYDYLVGKYGENSVDWVSQYAKEENVNLDGSDSAGYDIEYLDGNGKFFVEVKTNSNNLPSISFKLTAFEYTFAKDQSNYMIYVVTFLKSGEPSIMCCTWCDIQPFAKTPTGYLVEFTSKERS